METNSHSVIVRGAYELVSTEYESRKDFNTTRFGATLQALKDDTNKGSLAFVRAVRDALVVPSRRLTPEQLEKVSTNGPPSS